MRQLDANIPWALDAYSTNDFDYQRLEDQGSTYLYARSRENLDETYVLGAFDTPEQADLFVALHQRNPLFVPALRADFDWPVIDAKSAPYEGIYRVGFKAYRVGRTEAGWLRVEYSERYAHELIGEVESEIDACLAVYNHFDRRLRGCKLC